MGGGFSALPLIPSHFVGGESGEVPTSWEGSRGDSHFVGEELRETLTTWEGEFRGVSYYAGGEFGRDPRYAGGESGRNPDMPMRN